jgi:hypothetical protein
MERPSWWLMLVVLLLGLLFLREPRLRRYDEIFLRWLLKNSVVENVRPPLTIVDIGRAQNAPKQNVESGSASDFLRGTAPANSPLEAALFLQAALQFKPTVVAFEPVLQWPEQAQDEEQVFVDQAIRVPKLLLAAELTAAPDPDAPVADIPGFPQVTGRRGDLVEFSGVARQPNEDVRLISALGFINLPGDITDDIHVPLLFQYRGEVIPSFALQALLLWLRITPAEVKIKLGKEIELPQGRKIPIESDGTMVINPNAANAARRLNLNELLLAAQQREQGKRVRTLDELRDQVVLARAAADAASGPDVFAGTIATIQTNSFIRRVSWIFDCICLVIISAMSGTLRRFSRIDLLLGAIAFTAAYCLIALGVLTRWSIWLPGVLPLGAMWVAVLFCFVLPKPKLSTRTVAVAASPPIP